MLNHLACIMDGNRRWAKQKGWLPWIGHRQGTQSIKVVVDFCLEKKISFLSLYAFSLENFKRSQTELDYLFQIMLDETNGMAEQYVQKGVRVTFVGDRALFPAKIIPACERLERMTASGQELHLNILFCYGSRQEMAYAVRQLLEKVQTGELAVDQCTSENFERYLWSHGTPDPDMILRTGGVKRLSNFLLYQAAYAEFYFLDILWPELTKDHLEKALIFFEDTKRNYGS